MKLRFIFIFTLTLATPTLPGKDLEFLRLRQGNSDNLCQERKKTKSRLNNLKNYGYILNIMIEKDPLSLALLRENGISANELKKIQEALILMSVKLMQATL